MSFKNNSNIKVPLLLSSRPFDMSFPATNMLYQALEEKVSNTIYGTGYSPVVSGTTIDPKKLDFSSRNDTFFKSSVVSEDEVSGVIAPSTMFGFSQSLFDTDHQFVNNWDVPKTPEVDKFPVQDIFHHSGRRSYSLVGLSEIHEPMFKDAKRRKSEPCLSSFPVNSDDSSSVSASLLAANTSNLSDEETSLVKFEFHFEECDVVPLLDFLDDGMQSENSIESENFPSTPKYGEDTFEDFGVSERAEKLVLLQNHLSSVGNSFDGLKIPSEKIYTSDTEEDFCSDAEFKPKFDASQSLKPQDINSLLSDDESRIDSENSSSNFIAKLTSLSKVEHERAIIEQVQIKVVPPKFTPPATSSSCNGTSTDNSSTTEANRSKGKESKNRRSKRNSAAMVSSKQNKQFRPLVPGEIYYPCPKCDQFFRRPEHVKRHIRSVHTHVRPYKCEFCHKGFPRSDNLSQHLKTHMSLEEWNRLKEGNGKARLIKNIKKRLGIQ